MNTTVLLYQTMTVDWLSWKCRCRGLTTKLYSVPPLCPTLCDPLDCSPPGSSVHGISQASILEEVVISFSRGSSWPMDQTWVSCIRIFFFLFFFFASEFSTAQGVGAPNPTLFKSQLHRKSASLLSSNLFTGSHHPPVKIFGHKGT